MFDLEGLKPRVFILRRGTVYLHVAHHSTGINAIKSWLSYELMISTMALSSVFPGSSSFVMEMKLGPSLGGKGETRQQQIEPDP